MVNVVFMGTPDFAVPSLQALIETQNVVGVVTQPDRPAGRGQQLRQSPVKVAAKAANIPVYQPESLRSEASAAPIRAWRPDIIVVTAFGQILKPHLLEFPSHGCLNVHASLLPRWRGAAPIQYAILAGDKESGVGLMRMDVGLDTGPVYVSESVTLAADETATSLHDRLAALGGDLLKRHMDAIVSGQLTPESQDDALATYAPRIQKEDGRINWEDPAALIDQRTRAMTPWPGAFTTWDGKRLKLLTTSPRLDMDLAATPGSLVVRDDTAFVATGEGAICLERVQLAGKKPAGVADFIRGRPEFASAQLGH